MTLKNFLKVFFMFLILCQFLLLQSFRSYAYKIKPNFELGMQNVYLWHGLKINSNGKVFSGHWEATGKIGNIKLVSKANALLSKNAKKTQLALTQFSLGLEHNLFFLSYHPWLSIINKNFKNMHDEDIITGLKIAPYFFSTKFLILPYFSFFTEIQKEKNKDFKFSGYNYGLLIERLSQKDSTLVWILPFIGSNLINYQLELSVENIKTKLNHSEPKNYTHLTANLQMNFANKNDLTLKLFFAYQKILSGLESIKFLSYTSQKSNFVWGIKIGW